MTDARMERFGSGDCWSASYGAVLESLGLDPLILGDDWAYRYDRGSEGVWPLPSVSVVQRSDTEIAAAWYGTVEERVQHPSHDDAWARVADVTARGVPVIVCADLYYLPHSPLRGAMHLPHRLVVRSIGEGCADVLDTCTAAPYEGAMDAGALRAAMSSPHLSDAVGDDAPDVTVVITRPDATRPGTLNAPLAVQHVRLRARAFLDGDSEDTDSSHLSGECALHALADDIRAFAVTGRPPARPEFHGMLLLCAGVASRRDLNARLWRACGALLHEPWPTDAAATSQRLSERWLVLRNGFYRVLYQPVESLQRTADALHALAAEEASLAATVLRATSAQEQPAAL